MSYLSWLLVVALALVVWKQRRDRKRSEAYIANLLTIARCEYEWHDWHLARKREAELDKWRYYG